jgi:glycosyltransferase involved in cell wall biosynthesis
VVAGDCPFGPRELIGDNENGILVPMGNPSAMAEAMKKVLQCCTKKNNRKRFKEGEGVPIAAFPQEKRGTLREIAKWEI